MFNKQRGLSTPRNPTQYRWSNERHTNFRSGTCSWSNKLAALHWKNQGKFRAQITATSVGYVGSIFLLCWWGKIRRLPQRAATQRRAYHCVPGWPLVLCVSRLSLHYHTKSLFFLHSSHVSHTSIYVLNTCSLQVFLSLIERGNLFLWISQWSNTFGYLLLWHPLFMCVYFLCSTEWVSLDCPLRNGMTNKEKKIL